MGRPADFSNASGSGAVPRWTIGAVRLERSIASARVALSVGAVVTLALTPPAHRATALPGLLVDPGTLAVIALHAAYAIVIYVLVRRHVGTPERIAEITTWGDLAFATAINLLTEEGVTSPFYAAYAFAVLAVGFRGNLHRALVVTGVAVAAYLGLCLVPDPPVFNVVVVMRAAQLAVGGSLIAYLGAQRAGLEREVRQLEAAQERNRIARDLHDGLAQTLAAVTLRLSSCMALLERGRQQDAVADLSELRDSLAREYDHLRTYMRTLAGVQAPTVTPIADDATRFAVAAEFEGSGSFVDQVLQIMREAAANVRRHASARTAVIRVRTVSGEVRITVDDDGVGFHDRSVRPWSIASRAHELGGLVEVAPATGPGAHVIVTLPEG